MFWNKKEEVEIKTAKEYVLEMIEATVYYLVLNYKCNNIVVGEPELEYQINNQFFKVYIDPHNNETIYCNGVDFDAKFLREDNSDAFDKYAIDNAVLAGMYKAVYEASIEYKQSIKIMNMNK